MASNPIPIYSMRGVQDLIEVFDDRVLITPKGLLGVLNKGLKGTKTIPLRSISAIQFKEAGHILSGYIQFTLAGGNESRGGVFAATQDENTFMFAKKANNPVALQIKNYIQEKVLEPRDHVQAHPTKSVSEELERLVRLKQQGALSSAEFEVLKRKLIDQ